MKKTFKILGIVLLSCCLFLALLVGGYALYLQLSYDRLPDQIDLSTENNQTQLLNSETVYTAVTYNLGFGAYEPSYTFFMDTGRMNDGTKTQGQYSRAFSKERAIANIETSLSILQSLDSDFYLLQEVDTDSTRSYHVNQAAMILEGLSGYGSVYTNAFHSPYLFYPILSPHGFVQSGLLTLSRYRIEDNTRRSLPIDNGFITRLTDMDRCFTVSHVPVENGKTLSLITLHLTAYDEGGVIRKQQLDMLLAVMEEEYALGNYVIAGGDFNHDIASTIDLFPSEQQIPDWVYALSQEDLTSHFSFVIPDNYDQVPSCRGADIPYEEGVTYTVTIDGFIVSDNVDASSQVISTDFVSSDHQPVKLSFRLKD